jgi:hypothetical protein
VDKKGEVSKFCAQNHDDRSFFDNAVLASAAQHIKTCFNDLVKKNLFGKYLLLTLNIMRLCRC